MTQILRTPFRRFRLSKKGANPAGHRRTEQTERRDSASRAEPPEKYRDLLLAAWLYANTRSKEDRALMLAVGNDAWDGFPGFLLEMNQAVRTGHSKNFLRQDDVKHMYALLFVSIMNGLDANYLDKVGGALLDAASSGSSRSSKQAPKTEPRFL